MMNFSKSQMPFWMLGIVMALIFSLHTHSPVYGEGSIGVTYNQIVDDISYGATATYEHEFKQGDLKTSSQIQSGDKYLADAHASFTFDIGAIGIRPYIDATGKADKLESIDGLGGKVDYGLTLNIPLATSTEAGIGFFLRNANPFAPKVLYELVDGEYLVIDSDSGINYDNPAKANILGYTGFDISIFKIGLQGSIGLGQKDYWLISDVNTGFDLGFAELTVGLNIGNRWYKDIDGQEVSKADIAIFTALSHQWE